MEHYSASDRSGGSDPRRRPYIELAVDEQLRAEVIAHGGAPGLVLEQGGLTVRMSGPGELVGETAAVDSAALVAAETLYTAAAAWRDAVRAHHEAHASGAAVLRPIMFGDGDGDPDRAESVLALLLTLLRTSGGKVVLPVDEFAAAQRDVRSGVVWGLMTDWLDAETVTVYLADSHRGGKETP